MAPDAVRAGVQVLQQGGSAADAALATALAQVPLMLGNFVSYAGIMEFLYYDAGSGTIHSMNAGWDIPRAEADPLSIPKTEFPYAGTSAPSGRTALVPGFMAGLESAHERFGTLPFAALFEPAIDFARQGVLFDALQAGFLVQFKPVITRLPETAALFTRPDGQLYQAGDLYRQPLLAETLESVAHDGAKTMYTGDWAEKFVTAIQRKGGTITMEDMAAYQPLWVDPVSTAYAGYEIYGPGLPGTGGVNMVEAFNLIEAAGLDRYGHFARDPESLFWMMQIGRSAVLSHLDAQQRAALFPDRDLSPESRLSKGTAAWLWDRIRAGDGPLFNARQGALNTHSAAVVAVDRQGNVAAMTHTSNAYLYGGSGISVDGIYIPDPGSYQQAQMQTAGAGNRLPHIINPVIVLRDGQPVWASSCIGNVHLETLQRLASVLTFDLDLLAAQQAPTMLNPRIGDLAGKTVEQIFPWDFEPAVIRAVRDLGQEVEEIPLDFDSFALNRGILAAVRLEPGSGRLSGAVPAVLGGFAAGY
jgi:gamma-glutamyltranspeptidase/glutathione hydrolase